MESTGQRDLLPWLKVLEAQTSCTEVRGGQAGGISCLEKFGAKSGKVNVSRVRAVARKRFPLASDLAKKFAGRKSNRNPQAIPECVSFLGHTRFATSSANKEEELHPHEWEPAHEEHVWRYNATAGEFQREKATVVLHITHNGDFDILAAFGQKLVVDDVGLWLERVLHCPNNLRGDSPKIAGCMDLLRVQGRWAAAARLAYLRLLRSPLDVSGGETLTKTSRNCFPGPTYWNRWAEFFETFWLEHKNNVIRLGEWEDILAGPRTYSVNAEAEAQLIDSLVNAFDSAVSQRPSASPMSELSRHSYDSLSSSQHASAALFMKEWTAVDIRSFCSSAVEGFLRYDLYNAVIEFLSRAEGSFGLQAHSSLELGVVVIASKGQPMSFAFDQDLPLVLYGSEAEAVAVPVDSEGRWLSERLDLDSKGEVIRIGLPRSLIEGSDSIQPLLLPSGVEIRSFSLMNGTESDADSLEGRAVTVLAAPLPYDPRKDLVLEDLRVTPAVLREIDRAWADPCSIEFIAAESMGEILNECMHRRLTYNLDTIDLMIAGVEASLWVAEQFSADLKVAFPQLNVVTISANKLLGLGCENADKVYFPGSDEILSRRLDSSTCAILISQSGQTFPTLHAARKLSQLVRDRLWLITGCFHSKMELAMIEWYQHAGVKYGKNRVINNYSGHRPAEPTSVAIVATMHTLTRLMLHLIDVTRRLSPHTAVIHSMNSVPDVHQLLKSGGKIPKQNRSHIVLALSQGCVNDLKDLVKATIIPNACAIVGTSTDGEAIPDTVESIHGRLVRQGLNWGAHISENWRMLVYVFFYILLSVGVGLPIFGLLGDAIATIVYAANPFVERSNLAFSPRLYFFRDASTSPVIAIVGLVLQFVDALFFIFLVKIFTWIDRFVQGRPLWARHGKRTIVIVDNPCIHQLTEAFVSKLFSQSYSFCSVEVHGASGLDHFVHRFTHRVVRGLLLAVGRPDGRLAYLCKAQVIQRLSTDPLLAKSEASLLLSIKQAAFIRNPDYLGEGSGPDIFTLGHNPYKPDLGLCHSIALPSSTRRKFVDELLFENAPSGRSAEHSVADIARQISHQVKLGTYSGEKPLGSHLLLVSDAGEEVSTVETLSETASKDVSNNPAVRSAFSSKLEGSALGIDSNARYVQYLYESRVASLERYLAFCVAFHAMAKHCSTPWFRVPWDIARSQSNLRVATTGILLYG